MNALLLDRYQLTMAEGYLLNGKANQYAAFELFFRKAPFGGTHAIAAGFEQALEYLEKSIFSMDDLKYLRLMGDFRQGTLDYLRAFRFRGTVRAVPEGTIVFPQEPLLQVTAPLPEAQIVETYLLNVINFQTLIATKASRICAAASPGNVVEFGLRRAQGPDGGLSASRGAYIGGCVATSNEEAGKRFGIPVRGTHAHSWVQSFSREEEAFRAYAETFKDLLFLVDTYDTFGSGIPNAIVVAREYADRERRFLGVRLDSGITAENVLRARSMLDEAGFFEAKIFLTNDLDEYIIESLKRSIRAKLPGSEGERVLELLDYGCGTRLVTAYDCPALPGVYKLVGVWEENQFRPVMKKTAEAAKATYPGIKQIWRYGDSSMTGDLLGLDTERHIGKTLLSTVMEKGKRTTPSLPLKSIRENAQRELQRLGAKHKHFESPVPYPVNVSSALRTLRDTVAATL